MMLIRLLAAAPPPGEPISLDLNVLELMLFAFGLLVTIGVAITLYFVFTRSDGEGDSR